MEAPIINKYEKEINVNIENQYISFTSKDNQNLNYKGMFTKDFLSDKEGIFKLLSLNGIKDFFDQRIVNKEYDLKKDEQKISLKINYNNKTIELIIPKDIESMDKNLSLNLITELVNIKNENKEIKERLYNLEKKVSKLMKEENEDLKGFEKSIIKNKEEAQKILKWICPYNERKVALLYKATPEENTRDDFHRKCDNKGATVVLIETSKGRRFGGYTSLSWDTSGTWKNDLESFLFSLDNNKKYEVIANATYKVYSDKNYGPWFGNGASGFGLAYEKNLFIGNETHRDNYPSDKAYSTTVENELSGGKTFNISKMEVYQIISQ